MKNSCCLPLLRGNGSSTIVATIMAGVNTKLLFDHVLLFFVLLHSFVYIFKHFRSGKPKVPPSPPKLPIIGNLHQLATLPHCSLHALSKKYGPIMFLDLGCAPTVVVSFADMAKKSFRQMILFSQTGRKPRLPISYIMDPQM